MNTVASSFSPEVAPSVLTDAYSLDLLSCFNQALTSTQNWLRQFSLYTDLGDRLSVAFGNNFDTNELASLAQDWRTGAFNTLPTIELRSTIEINGAYGAFASATNTIYLSTEFLATHSPDSVANVLLEEVGHAIDARINRVDSLGDEGAIFSALVQGFQLDEPILQPLQSEDDSVVLTLDGQTIQLEQATPGINPAFDLIGLTQLRNDPRFAGIDGSGFSVAVIDSRMDFSHPLLQPNFRTFVNFTNSPTPDAHGTHVSGTVGARNENIGVAPDVGLIGLNVFPADPNQGAQLNDISRALQWVLDNHQQYNITAVNMSLGGGFYSSEAQVAGDPRISLVNRLEQAGITVVSAGGNSFKTRESQNFGAPAIFSTLAVGSVWQDGVNSDVRWRSGAIDVTTGSDRVVSHSQRLVAPNTIFAPGALINSTVPGGRTGLQGGTSMASPIVAGAVALMQEAAQQFGGRLLTPNEIVQIIRSTANNIFDGDDEDDNVRNTNVNYPRLNVYDAIVEVQRRFQQLAPLGDPNGTLEGAIIGPRLNGSPTLPLIERIGSDGGGATTIGARDVDIFRFEVLSPGEVTIELNSNASNPDDFDTYLRLFNANGQQIAANDDIQIGVNPFSRITTTLNPGVYFAGVSGYNNANYNPTVAGSGIAGETGNYAIQFSLSNTDPNGLISGAVPITFSNDQEPVLREGLIGSDYGIPVGVSDVDLFEVRVPDNGTLFIDIDTPFNNGFVDSFLRIFDANGNELVFSDDDLATDEVDNPLEFTDLRFTGLVFEDPIDRTYFNGHTTDSFVAGTVERGDVYYIGVSDYFNQFYNPNTLSGRATGGTGGLYNLFVTFINNDQNGSITQALDSSVVPLPVTGQRGIIGFDTNLRTGQLIEVGSRDIDFVRINSPTAGILEIDIDSYSSSNVSVPVDTVALIFDANGNLLALNDDSDSLDPLLQYRIAANTDYFVAITGYGNDNFDPFQLGSGSPGDIGEYIFNSRLLPLSQGAILSNNVIGNGAIQNVSIGSVIPAYIGEDNGFVTGSADIDLYRFTPTTNGRVNIQAQAFEAFSADTFLRFFDANGNQIAANDNETTNNRGSFLRVNVSAGSTYYIGVNGASPQASNYNPFTGVGAASGSQGSYTLILSESSAPPEPPVIQSATFELTEHSSAGTLVGRLPASDPDGGTLTYAIASGNRDFDRDGIAAFNINSRTGVITVTDNDDLDYELQRVFGLSVTVSDPDGLTATAVATINLIDGEDKSFVGTSGRDNLIGDDGDNAIIGGYGGDTLTGGRGADRFIFSGANTGGALRTSTFRSRDRITDFNFFEGDRFQLDFDNNLATTELPSRLYNAGRVRARDLRQAIEAVYDDPNGRKRGDRDLGRNEAAFFQFGWRAFLVVNDRNPNYSVRNDLIVDVAGIQFGPGDRSPGNLVVTEYFG